MASSGAGASIRRSWNRFRRRPAGLQGGAVVVVLIVVAAIAYGVSAGTSGSGGGSTGTVASGLASGGANAPIVPVDQASTSTRGILGNTINVVLPLVNLTALSAQEGFAGDPEDDQEANAIRFYVSQINDSGGINGRKINPIIVNYDPTSETDMRSLCKDWTEGTPAAFAVLDGLGAWNGDNQLCVTQEGDTPMLGEWTTVTDWTQRGSPYLWWLGPDQAVILDTVVSWAKSSGYVGGNHKLGIVAGDRASDQLALHKYLLPDLSRAGISHPVVETLSASLTDTATIQAEAPVVVQRLRAAGVDAVLPLIPFNSFYPYLQAETQQQWFPRLLLSDYESTINIGLGLIPFPYEKALDGQLGVTVETLGGIDDARPESQGGYDPGVRSCYNDFHASPSYPFPEPGKTGPWLEEQGPIVSWCQAIRLFAEAARSAGPDLNRRAFVEAMSRIENFDGTLTPTLTFGPTKFYGPVEYRVVRLHNNDPNHNACILTYTGIPQGTCWQVVQDWRPLVSS